VRRRERSFGRARAFEEEKMAAQRHRTAEAEIKVVIDDWADAMRAKDAPRAVSHRTEDFVQFSLAPPLVSDAADAKGLEAWFAAWRGPLGYSVHDLRITAGDDVAFAHSLNRLSGTSTDGEVSEVWFRHTLGFRKVGGAWKIAHEHESVPFYMDGSYKAAVDLEP
jgi:PhnB protein